MENNYIIVDGQLRHAGIKGMKWGVRRYQNKDGSLTELGKKRYYQSADKAGYKMQDDTGTRYKLNKKGRKVTYTNDDVDEWVRSDLAGNRRVADESSQLFGKLKSATDRSIANSRSKRAKMDLSNMSDKDMRDQINRAMLERQYTDMFGPKESTKGRERVSAVLDSVGTVLGVAGTALGIAVAIKDLKNFKKSD